MEQLKLNVEQLTLKFHETSKKNKDLIDEFNELSPLLKRAHTMYEFIKKPLYTNDVRKTLLYFFWFCSLNKL